MMKFEKLAQHIREYLKADSTTEEVGKVFEILTMLESKNSEIENRITKPRRRGSGSGKKGHLHTAVQSLGSGGSVRDIGNKARELGLRLPPDPIEQDRSVLRKLKQSQHVYKENEDKTWRLLRQASLKVV